MYEPAGRRDRHRTADAATAMTRKNPSARREKKHDAEKKRVEQISAALKGYYTDKEVQELLQKKREAERAALNEQREEMLKKQAEDERAQRDELTMKKVRKQQVEKLLRLLKPPQTEREDCKKHIEFLLDSMASVKRDAETKPPSDTAIRAHIAALRRVKKTRKTVGAPNDDRIDWEITWWISRLRRGAVNIRPSPAAAAVADAYELVTAWGGGADALTEYREGLWHRVAAALLGCRNGDIDLRRQIRKLKKQLATR
jgi:hypothetical protein